MEKEEPPAYPKAAEEKAWHGLAQIEKGYPIPIPSLFLAQLACPSRAPRPMQVSTPCTPSPPETKGSIDGLEAWEQGGESGGSMALVDFVLKSPPWPSVDRWALNPRCARCCGSLTKTDRIARSKGGERGGDEATARMARGSFYSRVLHGLARCRLVVALWGCVSVASTACQAKQGSILR